MSSSQKPTLVSLFSGAGCFDIGFEAAGFQNVLATDQDDDCCKTLLMNRRWNVVHAPIETVTSKEMLSIAGLRPRQLSILIGGPPCQPYSKSAFGTVDKMLGLNDERAKTVKEYFRAISIFLPRAFVIENVPQFITGKNSSLKSYLERTVSKINQANRTHYRLNYFQVNAATFGVPQIRERIFILASRDGSQFQIPTARFLPQEDTDFGIEKYRSCWDAIGHLAAKYRQREYLAIGGKWDHLLASIPPGQNYLWHTKRGGGRPIFKYRKRYWNFLLKLNPNLPSWTIAASPGHHTGPFHWDNRRLSVEELQLLQTIPDNYRFYGGFASARRQIGNGVPSAIGELLGKEIRRQIFGEIRIKAPLSLIPKKRRLTSTLNSFVDLR